MKKATLELVDGVVLKGYEAGNFIVYKDYYWQIAHKSGYKMPGFFARREDTVQVCRAADALADWDFDEPSWEIGESTEGDAGRRYRVAYVSARAQCTLDRGILRWANQPADQIDRESND